MTEEKEIHQEENEVRQWIEVFQTDVDTRLRAATELGLIGIRYRKAGQAVRGDLEKAASSLFPEISFADFWKIALSAEEQVQCEAAFAIGELAGEEIIKLLLQHLPNLSSGSKLHTAITRALGKIGGPAVKDHLFQQPNDEAAIWSIVGLVAQHKAYDEKFANNLNNPVRAATTTARLAIETRKLLEEIRDQHEQAYFRLLANQILSK